MRLYTPRVRLRLDLITTNTHTYNVICKNSICESRLG